MIFPQNNIQVKKRVANKGEKPRQRCCLVNNEVKSAPNLHIKCADNY